MILKQTIGSALVINCLSQTGMSDMLALQNARPE
jgi:hypothetical protein